jgi:SAM-dependent methyltransferase
VRARIAISTGVTDLRHERDECPGNVAYPAAVDARVEANRRRWDESVGVHLASSFYDVEGWLARAPGPRAEELAAPGDVLGRTLVHFQCHFGMDTLQFARAGAIVTGVDFSAAAISAARSLAVRAGLADAATFVCGDVLDAPTLLDGRRFDVAYVSLGSLCWLPSVAAWADAVASVLASGAKRPHRADGRYQPLDRGVRQVVFPRCS